MTSALENIITLTSASTGTTINADIAIIGGGIVGVGVLHELITHHGYTNVLLVEQNDSVLAAPASSGNSAMIHSAFDAPNDSLESRLMRRGWEKFHTLLNSHRLPLPYQKCGALLVAFNEAQLEQLPELYKKALANGLSAGDEVELVYGRDAVLQLEPHLSTQALGALHVKSEGIVDPLTIGLLYLQHAQLCGGARVMTHTRVQQVRKVRSTSYTGLPHVWELITANNNSNNNHRIIRAKIVVNCAGLHGDSVETMMREATTPTNPSSGGGGKFDILPRKGQFVVIANNKNNNRLVTRSILPVPSTRTKGKLIFNSVFSSEFTFIGPTAEDIQSRTDVRVDEESLRRLHHDASVQLPVLAQHESVAGYAGLRPASQRRDYQISASTMDQWITIGGIRSTGLTASLGIGEYVCDTLLPQYFPACIVVSDASSYCDDGLLHRRATSTMKWEAAIAAFDRDDNNGWIRPRKCTCQRLERAHVRVGDRCTLVNHPLNCFAWQLPLPPAAAYLTPPSARAKL